MGQSDSLPTLPDDLFSLFGSCMSSEVFELIAGDDTRFFVHKGILAYHSQLLSEATSGVWKEATDRKIDLKDWDASTIARLIQFLYTGDYQYPDPARISPAAPDIADCEVPELSDDRPSLREFPLATLKECASEHNFNEPLLVHAKVYALAHYKSIDALQALALGRLSATLLKLDPLEPDSHLALNIVNLARYVYINTDSLSSPEEPLRTIISHYVALNFAAWQTEPEAVELIANGGCFVKDVMAKLCARLLHTKMDVKEVAGPGTKFISKLRVVTQSASQHPPQGYVQEINCPTGNINSPRAGCFWLVPEYTTIAKESCTHFKVANSEVTYRRDRQFTSSNCDSINLPEAIKSQDVLEKITEVALVRSQKSFLNLGEIRGFDGITANMNRDLEGGDYVYLVWKSVKTTPS